MRQASRCSLARWLAAAVAFLLLDLNSLMFWGCMHAMRPVSITHSLAHKHQRMHVVLGFLLLCRDRGTPDQMHCCSCLTATFFFSGERLTRSEMSCNGGSRGTDTYCVHLECCYTYDYFYDVYTMKRSLLAHEGS